MQDRESQYQETGRVLFRWADGSPYRAYVRHFDDSGQRIDGQPDTRQPMRLQMPLQAGGMRETDETGRLHRLPLKVRTREALAQPHRDRLQRQAVLQAARTREAARRQAVRDETEAVPYWQPSEALLTALAEAVQDGRTWRHQSEAVQAEAEAGQTSQRQWDWLTRTEADGSRPALAVRAPGAVNGQEARHSQRWQGTSTAALQDWQGFRLMAVQDENGQPAGRQWEAVPGQGGTDSPWQCYRLRADGTREAWQPTEGGTRQGRRQRQTDTRQDRAARLREAAGTIRMGLQD